MTSDLTATPRSLLTWPKKVTRSKLRTKGRHCQSCLERPGKKVYLGSLFRNGIRVVFKVNIERTIRADGQILLFPEIEVETWWTSLGSPASVIVELYAAHGTSEQFRKPKSRQKTGLETRLPSGKFATNNLVLYLGLPAYNILSEKLAICRCFLKKESVQEKDQNCDPELDLPGFPGLPRPAV